MNVGIVGIGKMGLLHAGILNSINNVKITAVTEKERLISNYIKNSLSDVKVYQDYKKMLDSEKLDLVYVTTPIVMHIPVALSCMRKKINFFIEKPLSSNLNEAREFCTELRKVGLIHSVGYNNRFVETFVRVKSLLESEILGDISDVKSSMYVSNVFSNSSGWRLRKQISGGGVLIDLGSHVVDLLLWYFGEILRVSGKISSIYSGEVEDEAHMDIEFLSGIKARLDTSWSVKGYRIPEIKIEVNGSNGKLTVSEDFIKISLKSSVPELEKKDMKISKQSLSMGVPIDIGGPAYTKEDIHMIECVENKKQSLVNVFEASRTQSVIQAMYDAAGKNESIKVEYIG